MQGDCKWQINGGPVQRLRVNAVLEPGAATIITGPNSHVDLSVNGVSSSVRIDADSKIELSKMNYYGGSKQGDRETYLNLKGGGVLGNVRKISGNSRYESRPRTESPASAEPTSKSPLAPRRMAPFNVTFTSVTGQVIVAAQVGGTTVTHILNTGDSWTPGQGDVVKVTLAQQQQAQVIANIIAAETGQTVTLPPPSTPPPYVPPGQSTSTP